MTKFSHFGCFALLLAPLLFVSGTASAQKTPEPELIIEFKHAICDDMRAYIDELARPLFEKPGSKGLAIIYPKRDDPRGAIFFEGLIRWGNFGRFGDRPPRIVRAKAESETRVQLWLIPAGATEPSVEPAAPGELFANVKKEMYYNSEFGGEDCPAVDTGLIADLLNDNPTVDLKVIIRGKTEKYRNQKLRKWAHEILKVKDIPRSRVRFVKSSKLLDVYPYQDVEFWFVP
jgi:hypothetical protein